MFSTYNDYRKAWDEAGTIDPKIPLDLSIELAAACNAKCGFCLYGNSDWSDGMKALDTDGKPKKRFMPTEMAFSLIADAARIGIPALKMNYRGESTLHPDFSSIMVYASDIHRTDIDTGNATRAFHDILVNTNGNCPEKSLNGLLWATKVMISLDSVVPETYKKMRVGLSLEKAISTIEWLIERGHKNIWVRRVISNDNRGEDFVKSVRRLWGDLVHVSEHFAFDRNSDESKADHGDTASWERRYCNYPSQRLVVEASGRVLPCCMSWESELTVGKYPDKGLMSIWNSKKMADLRYELRNNVFKNEKCKNCTSFMAYNRPERDFVQDREA